MHFLPVSLSSELDSVASTVANSEKIIQAWHVLVNFYLALKYANVLTISINFRSVTKGRNKQNAWWFANTIYIVALRSTFCIHYVLIKPWQNERRENTTGQMLKAKYSVQMEYVSTLVCVTKSSVKLGFSCKTNQNEMTQDELNPQKRWRNVTLLTN